MAWLQAARTAAAITAAANIPSTDKTTLAPFTVGLVLSVVYGQFHYAVDAVAGLIVAGAVLVSHTIYYATGPASAPAALAERGLETGRA